MADRPRAGRHGADWSHPEFAAIAKGLQETAGLVFPPNRRESAEAGMRRAMVATCISDPRDLRRAVDATGETRDALITELTIGETFFLRESGQLEFLRSTVLPQLQPTIGQRRLRIWSAGCATGEEPYSIAILLREAGWSGGASILGTDIATARLAAARRGRYTAWSMRGVSGDITARYFEQRGKQFALRPELRQAVEFRTLNLASTEYPSAASGIEQMDIVFCRNVLIYFDRPTIAAIAARLLASLAPGGWLFLGASDPSIAEVVPCEVVLTGAGLAYRPAGTTSAAASVGWNATTPAVVDDEMPWTGDTPERPFTIDDAGSASWFSAEPEAIPGALQEEGAAEAATVDAQVVPRDSFDSAYDQGDYDAAARLAREALARGEESECTWVVLVRSLANRGQLDAAGEACAAGLDAYRLSAELTHLHAILLAEGGRHAEAAVAARRALYLDPHYAVAHLALGDALSRAGDEGGARRSFTNAESLLQALEQSAPVAGADGADASQLLGIARFRLATLRGLPKARSV